MIATIISFSALLLAVFGMNMGFGLQSTLLGVRAGLESFDLPMIGAIMAVYFVGYMGGSLFCPRLINQVGHIRTFAAMASLASASVLLHATFVEPWTWMVLRGLTGFCFAGLVMVAESWLNHAANNTNRGSMLATYMVVTLGATSLGQLLLNTAAPGGFNLFVLVSVLVSISLVPVTLTRRDAPPLEPTPPMSLKKLYDTSPSGVVGCLSTGMVNGAFWGMGAVFAQMSDMNNQDISMFMAVVVFGGILTQWPLGKLSDRMDRRLVIVGIAIAVVISSYGLTVFGHGAGVPILASGALFGMAAFPLYAVSIAHVNDQIPAKDFVAASSTLLLIYGIGAALGPLVASAAMSSFGPRGLFYYTAAVAFLLALYVLQRLFVSSATVHEAKEDFIAVPRTTPVALDMAAAISEERDVEGLE